ncbi:MAG: hypothetical protein AAF682_16995 [Planctomycetota bacterium]
MKKEDRQLIIQSEKTWIRNESPEKGTGFAMSDLLVAYLAGVLTMVVRVLAM